ncbi:protein-glutamine gamma-glutamyltransferase [Scatolibacter rhodanostii]|uniref:protein-glutamine gamma-glutamyltransferase n=1 Tax=Scatolibacter rhodanostii TaxID=2014781 RepID=UPI000C06FD7F|nr:protein-glutamine gamma-glutamyltransferase [Scatolibacter rhodanostii]
MIQVAGRPFDAAPMLAEYPLNSVQHEVLRTMDQSATVYRFDSVEELRFTLSMRHKTVEAAKLQSRSGLRFATFHDAFCNEEYWERTSNGGFQLKPGAVPSEAILDIFKNGRKYGTECATAMVIIIYKALLEVYGADLFNRTFKNIYLMDWSIRQPLLQEIGTPRKVPELLVGDRAYFMNPQVSPETSWWRGENVIVMLDNLFYGHGIGIRTAPEIIASLNRNRIEGATESAYLMDTAARPNYKKLFGVWEKNQQQSGPLVWQFPETSTVSHR